MSRPSPQFVTLKDLTGREQPVLVLRLSQPELPPPVGAWVNTFFTLLVATHGHAIGEHLEKLDIVPGDIHIIPAGLRQQLLSQGDLQGWLIAFAPSLLHSFEVPSEAPKDGDEVFPHQSLFIRGLLRLRPGPERWQRLLNLIETLAAETNSLVWGHERAAEALLTLLLTELFRELRENGPQMSMAVSPTVREALSFIEGHYLSPLSLQDVAEAVHRTPSHLATLIREQTGLTVGDWVREHRMVEARKLLATGRSVEETALSVGYADVTHFIRTFRKVHGQTPRVWRAQYLQKFPAQGTQA